MTPLSHQEGKGEGRYLPTTDGQIAYVAGDMVHVLTVESARCCIGLMREGVPASGPFFDAFNANQRRAADELEAALRRLYRADAEAHEPTGAH